MSAKEDLEAMLDNGPVADIFRAEEATRIGDAIGQHADAVNGSTFALVFAELSSNLVYESLIRRRLC